MAFHKTEEGKILSLYFFFQFGTAKLKWKHDFAEARFFAEEMIVFFVIFHRYVSNYSFTSETNGEFLRNLWSFLQEGWDVAPFKIE